MTRNEAIVEDDAGVAEGGPRAAAVAENPYATLPDRIRPEDMISEQATREPGDPTFNGRDTQRDWLLRYGA
jgi:hypothetical protein